MPYTRDEADSAARKFHDHLLANIEGDLDIDGAATAAAKVSTVTLASGEEFERIREAVKIESAKTAPVAAHGSFGSLRGDK